MSQPSAPELTAHQLQCMEIWNGNRSIENVVSAPGMEAWIFSEPYHGATNGGDVHYLSLCVGGIVTRLLLADVAGHGDQVGTSSELLRRLLRRFMNAKRQDRLVSELNRHFTELEEAGRFATAIVATWLSHKRQLLLTNAGHPRPLLYHTATGCWRFLAGQVESDDVANLPLGIDSQGKYEQFRVSVEPDDWLLLYTDSYVEVVGSHDQQLQESGLLQIVESLPLTNGPTEFGRMLNSRISEFSQNRPREDDTTLIVIRFNRSRRMPGVGEKLRAYGKWIGSLFGR